MPKEHRVTVYQYAELSDKAKEKARDWWRHASEGDNWFSESVIEDAERVAETLGITFDTHPVALMSGGTRYEPDIWWSLSYSQGDGACFEGKWQHRADIVAKLHEYADKDEELTHIATELQELTHIATELQSAKDCFAIVKKLPGGHRYSHEHTVGVNVVKYDEEGEEVEASKEETETVTEALRDFMRWIHRTLQKEYEYQNSNEQVADTIEANEYEFTEDGARYLY